MPSFFNSLFKSKDKEAKKAAKEAAAAAEAAAAEASASGTADGAPPATSPTPPPAAAPEASTATNADTRAVSPPIPPVSAAILQAAPATSRSASVHSAHANTSFAREESSNSQLGAAAPGGAGPVKIMVPIPRGGVKMMVPPPRGLPQGAFPMMHHHHHHHHQFYPGQGMPMMYAPGHTPPPQMLLPGHQFAMMAGPQPGHAPGQQPPGPSSTPPAPPAASAEDPSLARAPSPAVVAAQDAELAVFAPITHMSNDMTASQSRNEEAAPSLSVPPTNISIARSAATPGKTEVDVSESESDDIQFAEESESGENQSFAQLASGSTGPPGLVHQTTATFVQQQQQASDAQSTHREASVASNRPTPLVNVTSGGSSISFNNQRATPGSAAASPLLPTKSSSIALESGSSTAQTPLLSPQQGVVASPQRTSALAQQVEVAQLAEREPERRDDIVVRAATPLALSTSAPPTVAGKKKIADAFMSILCPQQYYARVTKVRDVRTINESDERRTLMQGHKILAATKGIPVSAPGQLFYPLVRFAAEDVTKADPSSSTGEQKTFVALFDVVPGTMTFADDERAAASILQAGTAQSCYVLSRSAIMLATPQQRCPIATLNVCWVPFHADAGNATCPTHHIPLELFDTTTRELVCALCLAKSGDRSRTVDVLSEMMSEQASRQIFHGLNTKIAEAGRHTNRLVHQHQRTLVAADRQRKAIDQQFDLLIAAIQAKREELRELAAEQFTVLASSIAKDILAVDEEIHIMKAASDHIYHSDNLKPHQMGTIAHAISVADHAQYPAQASLAAAARIPKGVQVNFDKAMTAIQRITLDPVEESEGHQQRQVSFGVRTPLRGAVRSPFASPVSKSASPTKAGVDRSAQKSCKSPRTPGRGKSATSPAKTPSAAVNSRNGSALRTRLIAPTQLPTEPGLDGTSLFNCPIHDLLKSFSVVTWTVTVEDPGDWVGVGVGVGGTAESSAWNSSATKDLTHLWIVPPRAPRTLVLKVTVSNGNAKLTVHDKRGKQLDDGRIAHWNASRMCQPQVTFGGRFGRVLMVKQPEGVTSL